MSKIRKTIAGLLSIGLMVCAWSIPVSADWVKQDSKTYYEDESGNYLTGWQTIDGSKYYFNKKGVMKTGWITMTNGNEYYFYKKTGKMATGWATINGEKYYFNKKGVLQHGYVKINNKIYYFDKNDGSLINQVFSQYVTINDKLYFCKSDGTLAKGILNIDEGNGKSSTYYFGDDYSAQSATQTVSGITFVFDAKRGLIDHYKKIPFSGYYDSDVKLVDFDIYLKDGKLYWKGYLENTSGIYDYWISVHADFYDKYGDVIESEHIMVLCEKLKAGQRYKINEYCYVDDYNGLANIEFTDILKHKK